ncbi:MAG: hypothetical protein J6T10_01510 [Methanobrevibacter sp.]|nr:hypothetical protein [Methanobrevibacter sp.]
MKAKATKVRTTISLNTMAIDLDKAKKIQEVLDKHEINFNYLKKMEECQEEINKGKGYEDLPYEWNVSWKCFKGWKKIIKNPYIKRLFNETNDSLFEFENGIISGVATIQEDLDDLIKYEEVVTGCELVVTLEELDKQLTKNEKQLKHLNDVFESDAVKKMNVRIEQINEEREKFEKMKDEELEKIQRDIKKIAELNKDFK